MWSPAVDPEIVYDRADMVLFVIYFGRSHISTVYGNNGPSWIYDSRFGGDKDLVASAEGFESA